MDIKQLRFLVALDEARHFGQAAERCHVTQPTLSMRLRNMEEELGVELVQRGQRFEGFTIAGERVLAWARHLLAAEAGLYAEAAACRGQMIGTLRLGVVPLAGFDPMHLIGSFSTEYPQLRFQLFALSSEEILERLGRNQLDLGLSYVERLNREHFTVLELAETRMGLLHDRRHFAFSQEALDWKALAELPLGLLNTEMHFRQSIDHGFRSCGLSPQPWLETDAVHQLLQAVGRGLCCSIIPLQHGLSELDPDLVLTPIANAQTLAPLGLIMRRSVPRSALAEACFAIAQRIAQPIDKLDQVIISSD